MCQMELFLQDFMNAKSKRLSAIGIKMPAMLAVDVDNERIVKEFIDGETIYDLVLEDNMQQDYLRIGILMVNLDQKDI